MSGTITLLGSPVTALPGDRMSATSSNDTVNLSNQITGPGTLELSSQATGAASNFTLSNSGTAANNWTGGTIIDNNASTDNLVVIDAANNQFGAAGGTSAGNMTFTDFAAATGVLTYNLNGFNDTIGALITNGAVNSSGAFVNNSSATPSTLTIGDNNATGNFSGVIENASASGLSIIKSGTGTQIFSGPNTFSGSTTVSTGILSYQNGTAFGGNSPIIVNPGATAQVAGGITGGTNTMTLSGSGAPNATGALENVSGNNSFAGPIILNANSLISSDSNTLTLAGPISGSANLNVVTGSAGTVALTGASPAYAGTATVIGGSLMVAGAGSINSAGGINVSGSTARFVANSSVEVPMVNVFQGAVDGTGSVQTVVVADSPSAAVQNGNGGVGTLTIGDLTFNGAGAFNLDEGSPTVPDVNVAGLMYTGAVNPTGIVTINASSAAGWTNGVVYDLVSYIGLLDNGSGPNDNIALGTISDLIAGQTAQLAISGTEITLTTTGGSSETWTGLDNNQWVVGTTGPNSNWQRVSPTGPVDFSRATR